MLVAPAFAFVMLSKVPVHFHLSFLSFFSKLSRIFSNTMILKLYFYSSVFLDSDFFFHIYLTFNYARVFFSSIICLILLKIWFISLTFSVKILRYFFVYFFKLIVFPYNGYLNKVFSRSSPIHNTIWSVSGISFSSSVISGFSESPGCLLACSSIWALKIYCSF